MIPNNFIEFYGDQTRWFMGRVINLQDPKELGRIQVRVYGIHTENTELIPDEDLPWAQVVVPITEGGTAGLGNNLGIQINSFVFGMFLDGPNSQLPLVIGSIPKMEDNEEDAYDSVSTSPLARGIQVKPYEVDSAIGEPNDTFAAVYPNNLVYETSAGHVKEYDNTDSNERIRELHKSGTFYQVNPDGTFIEHIVGSRYTVIATNDALHVSGSVNILVDSNTDLNIGGYANIQIGSYANVEIADSAIINVGGGATISVSGSVDVTAGGDATLTVSDGIVTIDTPQTNMTGSLRVDGGVSVGNNVVTDAGISLNTHTHTDTPGLGAGITSPPWPG